MTPRLSLLASKLAIGAGMLLLLLLILYLVKANPLGDQSRETKFQGIVSAASKFATEKSATRRAQCIRLEVTRITFKRWRSKKPGGELELGMADPQKYAWKQIDNDSGLDRAELKTALARAIAQDQRHRLRSLPAAWIDQRLNVVRDNRAARRCPVHILSEPAMHGNWAFIEDDIVCGPQCAAGKTLALRFVNKRWVVVAEAPTWHVGFERMLREPLPPPDSDQIVDL